MRGLPMGKATPMGEPTEADCIHVGKVGDTNNYIYIGSTWGYEECRLPLTGRAIHTLRFRVSEIPFLISALQKEQRRIDGVKDFGEP